MQPIRVDVGSDVLTSSTISAALTAYLADELGECLRLLDDAPASTPGDDRLRSLLSARALLRLHRSSEVVELLGPILGSFVGVDEALTARMLHAVAVFRTVSLDRGLSLLGEIATAADVLKCHSTIRAEIAYWIASAYWRKRDYKATLAYARLAESARADVISVRAATLRGYVASAKEHFPEALHLFRAAREAYSSCQENDANLLERIIVQIASLEVTLRSQKVSASHILPPSLRAESGRPTRSMGALRMQIAAMDSWSYAFDGDQVKAYRQVRIAEDLAPTSSWRMWALANRANVALAFGDAYVAGEFAEQARELALTVDWNSTDDEERVGLLFLVEALAVTCPIASLEVMHIYEHLTSQLDRGLLFVNDVRLWILEEFTRGLIYRVRGELEAACSSFKEVEREAHRVGYLWRAALALIELDATPLKSHIHGEHYLQSATQLVNEHFPQSFLARRVGRWRQAHEDAIAMSLAPQPREVLRHLLRAKSTKEIAQGMSISEGTVRNYFKTLFVRFDVHSREELLVAAYQRGIGDPRWWMDWEITRRNMDGPGA